MSMADMNARDGVLSPVSSAESKKSKSSVDNRVFERLSISSVQYFAESMGYDTHFRKFLTIISSDALCALTEDVNYRLRELAHKSVVFMRQRRGDKLTIGDVNEALKWSGTNKLLGHGSRAPPSLHFVKELNLFVPNEGVVDAPSLALAQRRFQPDVQPVLTGHLLPSLFETTSEVGQEEIARLKDICTRLLTRCRSCSSQDFKECLGTLKKACSLHPRCSQIVLCQLVTSIMQSPGNMRIWYCLRQVITGFNFARTTDGLRLICQISEFLTNSILHPEKDSGLSSMLTDFHYQLLAMILSKFDFLTSLHFDQALIRMLEKADFDSSPRIYQCRIIRSLVSAVDLSLVFANFDLIVDRFSQFIGNSVSSDRTRGFDDHDLHFGWKFLIDAIVQRLFRCLPGIRSSRSSVDGAISILLRLSYEAFADASLLPLGFHGSKPEISGRKDNLDDSKSGGQLLEEYWNSSFHEDEQKSEEKLVIDVKPTVITPRKRKRRREAADIFEFPKRLRLMHQRDIIFVFHRTQAIVRPVESTRNMLVGGDGNRRRNEGWERKNDQLFAKVMKRRKVSGKSIDQKRKLPPLIIDVSTIIL